MTISLVFTPLPTIAFSTLPAQYRTECSGVMALFRSLGGSMGVAVMETLLVRNAAISHADWAQSVRPFNRALQNGPTHLYWDAGTARGAAMLDGLIGYNAQIVAYSNDSWR